MVPKTIRCDAKLAEALAVIGETSPEAKRKILSGEVSIDNKILQGLPVKPKEEIEAKVAIFCGAGFSFLLYNQIVAINSRGTGR